MGDLFSLREFEPTTLTTEEGVLISKLQNTRWKYLPSAEAGSLGRQVYTSHEVRRKACKKNHSFAA